MTGALPTPTAALSLRRFAREDAPVMLALSQEQGMRDWIPDQVYRDEAHAREVTAYLIAASHDPGGPRAAPFVLGVYLPAGELVGHVGLSAYHDDVEVGYAIGDAHQGRGLASEAVRAMVTWGGQAFALPSILGLVASENAASCRVLEKAGFALETEGERKMHGAFRMVRTYRWR